ncbi:MAG: mechanosensitive ion channel domain-containing protein [Pseudomonadota bacterium]
MNNLLDILERSWPLLLTLVLVFSLLSATNWFLRRRWRSDPEAQFRFQLIMLSLSFAGLLAVVVALPVNDALRGQLLSLIGILLSAAIALSSTTFIGNIMAGIMLKIVKNARPGDFITVADLTGRVTEMDLLHTEIQTEFRDLVTVPNLYMVTQPLKVVRASGTIITAEVSLGYDLAHSRASEVLCRAADNAGLKDSFVQVRELGDFSIQYRVAGLLEEVTSLISARAALRAAMLDALHAAGIEIVSPSFMNTRAIADDVRIIPDAVQPARRKQSTKAEDIAFDKAEQAAQIEKLRAVIEQVNSELSAVQSEQENDEQLARVAELEQRRERLLHELETLEAVVREVEMKDKGMPAAGPE